MPGHDNFLHACFAQRFQCLADMGDFNDAVRLAPNQVNYFERGITLQMMNRHQEAIADFSIVIHFEPDAAAGYYSRAKSERAIGMDKQAEEDHHQGRIIDGR